MRILFGYPGWGWAMWGITSFGPGRMWFVGYSKALKQEDSDYARLKRERDVAVSVADSMGTSLRAVEAAARELIRQSGDEFGHPAGTRLREVHDADLTALAATPEQLR